MICEEDRINDSISRVRVERGIGGSKTTFWHEFALRDGPTDGSMDRLTDRVTYGQTGWIRTLEVNRDIG